MEIEDNNNINNNFHVEINPFDNSIGLSDLNEDSDMNYLNNEYMFINNYNNIEHQETKEKIIIFTKYSNLDPSLFLYEFISDYKCIFCKLIPNYENVNETLCCSNLICKECLDSQKDSQKNCPICNSKEMKTRSIKNDNKIFYKSFKNLIIKCPNKCDWQGIWSNLDSHLNECKLGYRYCKYKLVGCEFASDNAKLAEHEQSNDKYHLELAMKFISDKKIKELKFEIGKTCMTTCHPHVLTYMKTDGEWFCDGKYLKGGCLSSKRYFTTKHRFRCSECDFDLCNKCVMHYIKSF